MIILITKLSSNDTLHPEQDPAFGWALFCAGGRGTYLLSFAF